MPYPSSLKITLTDEQKQRAADQHAARKVNVLISAVSLAGTAALLGGSAAALLSRKTGAQAAATLFGTAFSGLATFLLIMSSESIVIGAGEPMYSPLFGLRGLLPTFGDRQNVMHTLPRQPAVSVSRPLT